MPLKGLDPILENLNAVIISAGQPQPETKSAAIPAPGAPHDGSVAQAQNLASPVKGAEKQADRSRGTLSSSRLPQDAARQSEAARIKTVEAEYPSNERSFDSGPNLAGTSQKIQAKPQAPATGQEKITVELQQLSPSVGTDGKATPNETLVQTGQEAIPAAESLSSKSRDSIKGFEQRVDLSSSVKSADAVPKNEAQAVAAETDSKEIPVELRQTSQGVEVDGKTTPNETLVQTGEEAIPAAESLSSKSRDSIDGFEKRVDLSHLRETGGCLSTKWDSDGCRQNRFEGNSGRTSTNLSGHRDRRKGGLSGCGREPGRDRRKNGQSAGITRRAVEIWFSDGRCPLTR